MASSNPSDLILRSPSSNVPHWWYHYYSKGYRAKLAKVTPRDLCLSEHKRTPDFRNYSYCYGICHGQIGNTAVVGETYVLMKTTVGVPHPPLGCLPTTSYIVGYFLVKEIDRSSCTITMDPNDSLLLLADPIRITRRVASRLFDLKPNHLGGRSFSQVLGSKTRNKHASLRDVRMITGELGERHRRGSENFLGKAYPGPRPRDLSLKRA
jgi:hypothetical protein